MKNLKRLITISRVGAVIGVASLVGCSTSSSHDERSEGRIVDDNNINQAVESRLKADPGFKFESVNTSTYGGVVQLSGFVDAPEQSQRAEEIARGVGGVTKVINGLSLKSAPMPPPVATTTSTETLTPTGKASGESPPPPAVLVTPGRPGR
jgi:hyperosmotically inducible periplasmic protein